MVEFGHAGSVVVLFVVVADEVALKLRIPTHKNSICPRRCANLRRRVIQIAIYLILVRRIKIQLALHIVLQYRVLLLNLRQLVILRQLRVVLLLDHLACLLAIQVVDSEIHVAEQELVVVVALLLRVGEAEVLERVVVDLLDVLEALVLGLLVVTCGQVAVDEGEGGVIEVEPDAH